MYAHSWKTLHSGIYYLHYNSVNWCDLRSPTPKQGYISYPRTETTHYPENFDIVSTLKQLSPSPDWGADIRDILSGGTYIAKLWHLTLLYMMFLLELVRPRKGQDVGDHPPITPTSLASREELDHDSWRLYDYIVRHFIGTVRLALSRVVQLYQSMNISSDHRVAGFWGLYLFGDNSSIRYRIRSFLFESSKRVASRVYEDNVLASSRGGRKPSRFHAK